MLDFKHNISAHCENGVTRNLLQFYGYEFSEPMIFGLGSGIFFSHIPFIKLNGLPVSSFRPLPSFIFKRVCRNLGFKVKRYKFSKNPDKAMQELDKLLAKDMPVGLLVGVYNLPYFPKEYRFHFNAHNITVFGKENDKYYVSDPVMEGIETLTYSELRRVRYARGTYPPHGRMYHIVEIPKTIDLKKAIYKSFKRTCSDMLTIPIPMFGVKGIYFLAKRMRKWEKKYGIDGVRLNLGQVIRMLEEIGTGGAGFRFMYAAYLQECAVILDKPLLNELSKRLTKVGDQWREFSYKAARVLKNRGDDQSTVDELADLLVAVADEEKAIFKQLKTVKP